MYKVKKFQLTNRQAFINQTFYMQIQACVDIPRYGTKSI